MTEKLLRDIKKKVLVIMGVGREKMGGREERGEGERRLGEGERRGGVGR